MHFTIIIVNTQNTVVANTVYRLTYNTLSLSSLTGSTQTLPNGYDKNTMMGICGFKGSSTNDYFSFMLNIGSNSNGYGISIDINNNALDIIYVAYLYI